MAKQAPVVTEQEIKAADAAPETAATTEHTVAQWVGHAGTTRIISKADQDTLIGVKGVAKADLVWEAGTRGRVDVTDCDPAVIDYLDKEEDDIKLSTVEVLVEAKAEGS